MKGSSKPKSKTLCAIYTRVSTSEQHEQEFSSLDAQRESGEAYIASQRSEGWELHPTRYDDGGLSGANMERPALRRLLQDAKDGRFQMLVIYKIDRLTRSSERREPGTEPLSEPSLISGSGSCIGAGWTVPSTMRPSTSRPWYGAAPRWRDLRLRRHSP